MKRITNRFMKAKLEKEMKTNPTTEALGKESYQTHQFEKASNMGKEKKCSKTLKIRPVRNARDFEDWTTCKNYY